MSTIIEDNPLIKEAIRYLTDLELLGEEVLSDKHQLVELDRKRNANREALRKLKQKPENEKQKEWVCFGNMFIQMPTKSVSKKLTEDQIEIEKEIRTIQDNLKPKVARLHKLEGEEDISGFFLKGFTPADLKNMTS
ncbi:P53 and DNA damage-regulated protein 1-like [Oopsacas minuta]|uniref:P53 and DNA damage-regulated protein 1-like n=1 Tax=Oopsacas minuta TaxID=111878 RepID=A0AAV7JUG0_9METZ|nr:P53 and DNA damage-regulated protein 1-like [Oopsacas minuta]